MEKLHLPQHVLSLLMSLCLGATVAISIPAIAQESSSSTPKNSPVSVAFQPPAGEGTPQATAGGASRGKCPNIQSVNPSVTALVPALQEADELAPDLTGLTFDHSPTFYFYVPAISAQKAAFSLKDEQNNDVYQVNFPLAGKTGIISVKLPSNVPPLTVDQTYRWSFGIICEAQTPEDIPEVVFVTGEIRRTPTNTTLNSQLQQATPLEQVALYSQNGIWFEGLATLAQLRRSQPNDPTIASLWQELLQSVGLESIADQPFVN